MDSHRRKTNRDYLAKRRAALKADGRCQWCKQPARIKPNGKPAARCETCEAKARPKSQAAMKRKRVAWSAFKLCIVCGREPMPGTKWCGVCAERSDTYKKEKRHGSLSSLQPSHE